MPSEESKVQYGAIVQFVSDEGERRWIDTGAAMAYRYEHAKVRGRVKSRSRPATTYLDGLRWAIDVMEGWLGSWKIETISTPETILRDMQGSRVRPTKPRLGLGSGDPNIRNEQLVLPELHTLGRLGRLDLLAR